MVLTKISVFLIVSSCSRKGTSGVNLATVTLKPASSNASTISCSFRIWRYLVARESKVNRSGDCMGEGDGRPSADENQAEKAENMEDLWQPGMRGVP